MDLETRICRLEDAKRPESPITQFWREFGFDYCDAVARGDGRDAVIERMKTALDQDFVQLLIEEFESEMANGRRRVQQAREDANARS